MRSHLVVNEKCSIKIEFHKRQRVEIIASGSRKRSTKNGPKEIDERLFCAITFLIFLRCC